WRCAHEKNTRDGCRRQVDSQRAPARCNVKAARPYRQAPLDVVPAGNVTIAATDSSTVPDPNMSFLGLRKWPTPVAKPMWPFVAASAVTFFLVSKAQDMGVKSETWRNDPRNPYAAQIAKEAHH
ncbi:ATP synthase j chain-domain-containing protein, partial [Fomitopsis serialis]|uniref:ATP synthase j chain-domain-containing protein n=1 Tax=Fomitopsis serialis TaxID=139415 RepID=UPI002007DEAA